MTAAGRVFLLASLIICSLAGVRVFAYPGQACAIDSDCSGFGGFTETCQNGACHGQAGNHEDFASLIQVAENDETPATDPQSSDSDAPPAVVPQKAVTASDARDTKAPIKDQTECIRGSDSAITIGGMPTLKPNEHLSQMCTIKFVDDPDVDATTYFASANVFVKFQEARARHFSWLNYMKSDSSIKEEAHNLAEASADRDAIGNCRDYASAHERNPDDCRWLAAFESAEGFFTDDDGNSTHGGYWARSLAILSAPIEDLRSSK